MKHYCENCGKELGPLQIVCPSCLYCSFSDNLDSAKSVSSILTASQLELNTQWDRYKCGKDGICGHGFAAEDLNSFYDKIRGNQVEDVGRDNSPRGPDRIVNGTDYIQTKYCSTPHKSVEAAFNSSEKGGNYAYWENGKPQTLEVPYDQYDECVDIMKQKIAQGKVTDQNGNVITDTNKAYDIVKRGNYTYQQAKNVARAGNIDSLKFDFQTGAVSAFSSFGISFAINLALTFLTNSKNRLSVGEAIKLALLTGLKNGTISMTTHILTSQMLKTGLGRSLAALATKCSKGIVDEIWKTDVGKNLIQDLAKTIISKEISGGAAKQVVVKFLRTNAVGQLVTFVVSSIPDTIDVIRGRISGSQFIENLVVTSSSLAGATVGGILLGRFGGAAALGGALAGGQLAGWLSQSISGFIHKKDSEKMQKIIKVAMIELSNDYLIQSEDEFNDCVLAIQGDGAINTDFLKSLYSVGKETDDDFLRAKFAYKYLEYYFSAVIRRRKTLKLRDPKSQQLIMKYVEELGRDIDALNK